MRPSCGKVFGVQGSRGGRYGPHPGGSPAWQPSRRGNQSLRSDYAVGDARRRSKTHTVCLSDPRIRCAVHAVDVSKGKAMRITKPILFSALLTFLAPLSGFSQDTSKAAQSGTAKLQVTQCALKVSGM